MAWMGPAMMMMMTIVRLVGMGMARESERRHDWAVAVAVVHHCWAQMGATLLEMDARTECTVSWTSVCGK